ncbi:hypothetical protein SAMN02745245_00106 [Anaerosphaera aminiphila DSM 21120]|uniref:Uncharacterized protein n=1 Tax=Anaerosphaera aminiphila DSM 21120 TaxID=1120995 RepID=A0A1M5NXX4_9FIRM|nr:hypothetical protein [Anaerosphaera aminiphila]SHG94315.1 hypothetical protein SAMN02745245_00106 [Anaerosphaera aminiphila DSM 21120]
MNYEENLNILKDELEKAKNLKYKAEARLEQLNVQKEILIKEIKDLGIEPENLDSEIDNLKKEIDNLFDEAEKLIPRD